LSTFLGSDLRSRCSSALEWAATGDSGRGTGEHSTW
jgi:hypothetical protein